MRLEIAICALGATVALASCTDSVEPDPPADARTKASGPATPHSPSTRSTGDTSAKVQGRTVDAWRLLNKLKTSPERDVGYVRTLFADWLDTDGDGCDTREDVLIVESLQRVRTRGTCDMVGGEWISVYDGLRFSDPSGLDIDHMVPLAEAWRSGASSWSGKTRGRYSNDQGYPYSLNAVSAGSNRSKGDGDPSEWLPPLASFRCEYAKQYTAVKWRWSLSVDAAEERALRRLINSCQSTRVAKPIRAQVKHSESPPPGGGQRYGCSPHYSGACIPVRLDVDCSEILDRNFYVVDEDVYDLDGDGNGIACET